MNDMSDYATFALYDCSPEGIACLAARKAAAAKNCMTVESGKTSDSCSPMCALSFQSVLVQCAMHPMIKSAKKVSEDCNKIPDLPKFDSASFETEEKTFVTVLSADALKVTLAPTKAPTPAPKMEGVKIVETTKEVKTIEAAMKFGLTEEEAKHPVLVNALECGFGSALGLPCTAVEIYEVAGKAFSTGRRRLADIEIKFRIQTSGNDEAQAKQLSDNVKAAGKSGAIVASIKREANTRKVLVPGLKAMSNVQEIAGITVGTATITVFTVVKTTAAPTKPPTPAPPTKPPTTEILNAASLPALTTSSLVIAFCLSGLMTAYSQ